MKLRKLTLHNVRRFANKTAVLGPFGDGLTTITAENENGKSTFFDALHALFFYEYGSGKKELKEMQPYSGGAMRIAAEVELEGDNYLIEKIFNLKKAGSSATITALANGIILKQADDAEQWIQQKILTVNNGPFGLLWVRQGTIGVDASPDGVDTRRDVMSSVRGQIDAVTGGRRMDSIVHLCKQELDTISTRQDKPKAGSQWKSAADRVEQLSEEHDKLAKLVEALSHDLGLKRRVAARLRELQEPELRTLRVEAITDTEKQLTATREHDRKVQEAKKDIQLLLNEEQGLERGIKTITDTQKQREVILEEISAKETSVDNARVAKSNSQDGITNLQLEISELEKNRRTQIAASKQIRQTEREAEKRRRLAAISDLSQRLKAPKEQLSVAAASLGNEEITQAYIDRLSELERRREIAIETRKVHFSRFTMLADATLANIDGIDIPNGEHRLIDQGYLVTLPGFGSMSLQPAEDVGYEIANPESLQAEIHDELKTQGFETVSAAQHAYTSRRKALQDHQAAQLHIRTLAPDGLEALEREWAVLCDELRHPVDQTATYKSGNAKEEITSEAVERDIASLDEDIEQLREELAPLQSALAKDASALTEGEVLLKRLRTDQAELAVSEDEGEELNALKIAVKTKAGELLEARTTLEKLLASASDLPAAIAQHERAVQADSEDKKEIHRLERDLARLDGAIHTQTEGAVEERLAEVSGKLVRAKDRAVQFEDHVKVLRLLIEHLEAARTDAQETYFEPVRNELLPLLRQLHTGADFQIDADKLLIETITRDGVTDKIASLSGGASEQIAILTRLAFARLFAKHGNHVPIILDDALVHTDDERISTMFNMLSQIARDQQIIVLSCRTRAFSDLGGERAFITELTDGVE